MTERKGQILEKIGIALNADDIEGIPYLVETAFDIGCTLEEIKNVARNCIKRPDFDVICEFCRVVGFEEKRRSGE